MLLCAGFAVWRRTDLGVEVKNCPLECFWPRGGPFWDALGKTDRSQILLVESKSYIGEMRGKGSGASNPKSVRKIASTLKKTQEFLGGSESVDWFSSPYYQYANRLAHLYHFVELNGIDAYFLAIYFLNDRNMGGPHSSDHWEDAIQRQYADMMLPQDHRLRDRIIELFLDVRDLGGFDKNI